MGEEKVELRGVDADHFWYGDVLVDLNQLVYEQNRMSLDRRNTDHQIHEIGVALSTVGNYSRKLAKGMSVDPARLEYALKRLHKAGLHTGVSFKE